MKKSHFNYIICGGGASGLLLAFRICNDPFFKNKSILLIEKEHEKLNDRDVAGITNITKKINDPKLPIIEDNPIKNCSPTMPPKLF